jgi:hypothetical protein
VLLLCRDEALPAASSLLQNLIAKTVVSDIDVLATIMRFHQLAAAEGTASHRKLLLAFFFLCVPFYCSVSAVCANSMFPFFHHIVSMFQPSLRFK